MPMTSNQNIQKLGAGDAVTRGGAVQILLLVDYIFDSASDLSLPEIKIQLNMLSKENFSQRTAAMEARNANLLK